MPPVGFEPTISTGERPQTYALDRAATGTDKSIIIYYINQQNFYQCGFSRRSIRAMLHLSHSSSRYTHMFSRYFVGSVSYRVFRYGMICITFLVTPRSRVLLEKLAGPQLVKKFPSFYGTRRFITAFTSAHYLSLS